MVVLTRHFSKGCRCEEKKKEVSWKSSAGREWGRAWKVKYHKSFMSPYRFLVQPTSETWRRIFNTAHARIRTHVCIIRQSRMCIFGFRNLFFFFPFISYEFFLMSTLLFAFFVLFVCRSSPINMYYYWKFHVAFYRCAFQKLIFYFSQEGIDGCS